MRQAVRTLLVASLMAAGATAQSQFAEAASMTRMAPTQICKRLITAKATTASPTTAKNKAVARWQAEAASRYGPSFADIDKAKIISVPISYFQNRWTVAVHAHPCKPIGLTLKRRR